MDILGVEKDRIVKRFLTACQRESEESFLIYVKNTAFVKMTDYLLNFIKSVIEGSRLFYIIENGLYKKR